jgi:hypothetical protein
MTPLSPPLIFFVKRGAQKMDYLRRIIGVAPSSGGSGGASDDIARRQQAILERHNSPTTATQDSQQTRLTKLCRAQEMQLDQLQEERDDVDAELNAAVAAGNRKDAAARLRKRRELDVEIQQLQGKMKNTRTQLVALQTSHANVEQVLLIKEGAAELQAATQVVEQLDARGAMDRMQDSMALLEEQNRLLTEPIGVGGGSGTIAADYEAEQELNALMATAVAAAQQPAPQVNNLPDVPVTGAEAAPAAASAASPEN